MTITETIPVSTPVGVPGGVSWTGTNPWARRIAERRGGKHRPTRLEDQPQLMEAEPAIELLREAHELTDVLEF